MFVDQMTIILVAMTSMVPVFVWGSIVGYDEETLQTTIPFQLSIAFIWSIILNKDSYNGQSPGKIYSTLHVVTLKGKEAQPIQCVIRNLFILIWPIELLVTLFNPSRRLGDIISGTKVAPHRITSERSVDMGQLVKLIIPVLFCWFIVFVIVRASMKYF